MNDIHFIDTTLRDGQQSLWALGMKTEAMLGAAAYMDRIGFESMEFFVSIMIKKYVREHKENPWLWLREGVKHFHRTRLRNHGGLHGSGAMEKLPESAMKLLAVAASGSKNRPGTGKCAGRQAGQSVRFSRAPAA
jgi:oxaloacetate decarboxylase alpha subunit